MRYCGGNARRYRGIGGGVIQAGPTNHGFLRNRTIANPNDVIGSHDGLVEGPCNFPIGYPRDVLWYNFRLTSSAVRLDWTHCITKTGFVLECVNRVLVSVVLVRGLICA